MVVLNPKKPNKFKNLILEMILLLLATMATAQGNEEEICRSAGGLYSSGVGSTESRCLCDGVSFDPKTSICRAGIVNVGVRFESTLEELIVRIVDHDLKSEPIVDISQLQRILHPGVEISSQRVERYRHMIKVLGEYQFGDTLAIRELIANGLDSYYYDSHIRDRTSPVDRVVNVRTSDAESTVEVEDDGIGMTPGDISYFLLTPGRSKNNVILSPSEVVEGATGKFGQGFLSALSFLKNPSDTLIVDTKTESGNPVKLTLSRRDEQYYVQFEPGSRTTHGTRIRIHSKELLKPYLRHRMIDELQSEASKYFKYSQRGSVVLNGDRVNSDLSNFHHREIKLVGPFQKSATLYASKSIPGSASTLSVTVNGVLIKDFSQTGLNLYSDLVINLPSDTPLTQDRSTLGFSDPTTKSLMSLIAKDAIQRNDVTMINTLYPLLGPEGFDLLEELPLGALSILTIPAEERLQDISWLLTPEGPRATQMLHSNIFLVSNLKKRLPTLIRSYETSLIPYMSSSRGAKQLRIVDLDRHHFVFLDQSIDPRGPLTYRIINDFYSQFHNQRTHHLLIPPQTLQDYEELYPTESIESERETRPCKVEETTRRRLLEIMDKSLIKYRETAHPNDFFSVSTNARTLYELAYKTSFIPNFCPPREIVGDWIQIRPFLQELENLLRLAEKDGELRPIFKRRQIRDLSHLSGPDMESSLQNYKEIVSIIEDKIRKGEYQSWRDFPGFNALDSDPPRVILSSEVIELMGRHFPDMKPVLLKLNSIFQEMLLDQEETNRLRRESFTSEDERKISDFLLHYPGVQAHFQHLPQSGFPWGGGSVSPEWIPFDSPKKLPIYLEKSKEILRIVEKFKKLSAGVLGESAILHEIIHIIIYLKSNESEVLDFVRRLIEVCRKEGFYNFATSDPHLGNKIIRLFDLDQLSHGDPTILSRYLKHLITLGEESENLFSRSLAQFLIQKVLISEDPAIISKGILLLGHFERDVCNPLLGKVSTPELKEQIESHCRSLFSDLWGRLHSKTLKGDELNHFTQLLGSIKFYSHAGAHEKVQSLDELYEYLVATGIINSETIEFIYPAIYGDSVKFRVKNIPFPGDIALTGESRSWISLAEHPRVKEVLGKDTELNRKAILGAVGQHPDPNIWIKEILKNSREAKATHFDLSVTTDPSDQLTLRVADDGSGIAKDKLGFLYIPGYSSKSKDSSDINFGWGFFTLFSIFDDVTVETSPDGKEKNTVRLRKVRNPSGDTIEISESTEVLPEGSVKRGTQLFLRKQKPAKNSDPVLYKAHLIRTMQGMRSAQITFNDEPIQALKEDSITGKQPLLTSPLSIDDALVGAIEVYQHPIRGLYYNGLFESNSLESYQLEFPELIKNLLKKLSVPVVLNLSGYLAQNSNRTGFREEAKFKSQIQKVLQEGSLSALALEWTRNFRGMWESQLLPYDYFYEFRPRQDSIEVARRQFFAAAAQISAGKLPFDVLTQKESLGFYVAALPLFSPPAPWGSSLLDLKYAIQQWLIHEGVMNERGQLIDRAGLRQLSKAFPQPEIQQLVEKFVRDIEEKSDEGDSKEKGETLTDFSVVSDDTIPEIYRKDGKLLRAVRDLIRKEIKKFLGRTVNVQFYHDHYTKDGAHARPGTDYFAMNLAKQPMSAWYEMMKTKKLNLDLFVSLVSIATHEMVHLDERSIHEGTHNDEFFEKQQKLLEPFLHFSTGDQEDTERFLHSLGEFKQ